MADHVPSDHPSVTTVRATLSRRGRTDRASVRIPAERADEFPEGEVVRLVLDERECHARVDAELGGGAREFRGAFDSPRLARSPGEGANRLDEWVRTADLSFGGSVLVDVVEPGFQYGVREPGERAVYDARDAPDDSLASIAREVEDRD